MICAPDSTHRPCDCGADSPNCEVCDERWPCTEATVAQVLAKPYLNARPHGQPDQWREGYNQALREIRRVLAVASPRAGIRRSRLPGRRGADSTPLRGEVVAELNGDLLLRIIKANPDTHGTTSDGEPYCESCGVCDEGWRCRCCLAAEVEALRAQVQRVRELRDRFRDHEKWVSYRNVETLLTHALEGDA
jgi:hypothetical protein